VEERNKETWLKRGKEWRKLVVKEKRWLREEDAEGRSWLMGKVAAGKRLKKLQNHQW